MKRYLSRLLALVLVAVIGLAGCSGSSTVTGNYSQDALSLIGNLRTAITLPADAPNKIESQAIARQQINDFAARYRRDDSVAKRPSFTTIQTALNGLASHYNAYPNRPVPQKLKDRLEQELRRAEASLNRGA